jgi:hypothetical protein
VLPKVKLVRVLFALGVVITLPEASIALEFIVKEYRGQRVLLLEGAIEENDSEQFENTLRQAGQIAEVLLDSPGGSERDGLAIGRLIRRRGLSTRILANARCESACADVFLGGVARRVEEGGHYGIHMATAMASKYAIKRAATSIMKHIERNGKIDYDGVREVIQEYEKDSAQAASRWAAYVLEMGASPRIVDEGTKVHATGIKHLTREELIDLNIVNVDN